MLFEEKTTATLNIEKNFKFLTNLLLLNPNIFPNNHDSES